MACLPAGDEHAMNGEEQHRDDRPGEPRPDGEPARQRRRGFHGEGDDDGNLLAAQRAFDADIPTTGRGEIDQRGAEEFVGRGVGRGGGADAADAICRAV